MFLGYTAAILALATHAVTAGDRLESMLTFWMGACVAEAHTHTALLHAGAAYMYLRRRLTPELLVRLRDAVCSGGPASLSLRDGMSLASAGLALASLLPFAQLSSAQWRARSALTAALSASGTPLHMLSRPLTPMRVAAALLPDFTASLLSRNVIVTHGIVYGQARKGGWSAATPSKLCNLRLSVWRHRDRARTPAPCMLYIHGGGWIVGNPGKHSLSLMYEVARAGWIVFTISYRLAPRTPFPHMLFDCKRALGWIRAHAGQYGGDPSFVVAAGESAGGHLALMMGLTPNVPAYQRAPDMRGVDTTVQGVVDLYGVADWTDAAEQYRRRDPVPGRVRTFLERLVLQKKYDSHTAEYVRGSPRWWVEGSLLRAQLAASGIVLPPALVHGDRDDTVRDDEDDAPSAEHPEQAHASASADASRQRGADVSDMCVDRPVPPIFIIHGTCDTLVPLEDSELLWQALQARRSRDTDGHSKSATQSTPLAAPVVADAFAVLPGAHHAFNFLPSFRALATGDAIVDWLEHLYAREMMRRRAATTAVVRPRL